jgi:hypothetical protein
MNDDIVRLTDLPDIGTYWTEGSLMTGSGPHEFYTTCARCGSLVNSPDRHEDWHRLVEPLYRPVPSADTEAP